MSCIEPSERHWPLSWIYEFVMVTDVPGAVGPMPLDDNRHSTSSTTKSMPPPSSRIHPTLVPLQFWIVRCLSVTPLPWRSRQAFPAATNDVPSMMMALRAAFGSPAIVVPPGTPAAQYSPAGRVTLRLVSSGMRGVHVATAVPLVPAPAGGGVTDETMPRTGGFGFALVGIVVTVTILPPIHSCLPVTLLLTYTCPTLFASLM